MQGGVQMVRVDAGVRNLLKVFEIAAFAAEGHPVALRQRQRLYGAAGKSGRALGRIDVGQFKDQIRAVLHGRFGPRPFADDGRLAALDEIAGHGDQDRQDPGLGPVSFL